MYYLNQKAQLKGVTIHPLTEAEKEYNLVSKGPIAWSIDEEQPD